MALEVMSEPVLDPAVVADLRRLQAARWANLFFDLLTTFQTEAPKQLAAMRTAAEQANPTDLRLAAHNLKGAAASLGATQFAKLAGLLEALGRTGSVEGTVPILELLDAHLPEIYAAMLAEHQRRE